MKLCVKDAILTIYDILPKRFTLKDLQKLINNEVTGLSYQLVNMRRAGLVRKIDRTHYTPCFANLEDWLKVTLREMKKKQSSLGSEKRDCDICEVDIDATLSFCK